MSKPGYVPLAKVGKGKTLCSSASQDQYFLVTTNGQSEKLSLQAAVLLYQKAAKTESNLIWKRKFKRRPKATTEAIAAEEDNAQYWSDKLRASLGLPNQKD
jgi:hypothetical protein